MTFLFFIGFWIVSLAFGYLIMASLEVEFSTLLVVDLVGAWIVAIILTFVFDNKRYKIYPGGIATRVSGSEGIDGYLFLAPNGLLFHPHIFKGQTEDTRIPYPSISSVEPGNTSHSIEITTEEGVVERFAVKDRDKWLNDIRAKMKGQPEETAA